MGVVKEGKVKAHKKLIGRILAKDFLKELRPNTMRLLKDEGLFNTHFMNDLYTSCIPWIYSTTTQIIKDESSVDNFVSLLLQDTFDTATKDHGQTLQKEKDRKEGIRQRILQQEEEEARNKAQRRKDRAERRRHAEKEKLKNRILELIIKKGEEKEDVLAQDFGNVHGYFQGKDTVGIIGGIFTELAITFTAISEILAGKEFLNEKNAYGIMIFYLAESLKQKEYPVYISPGINKFLSSKNVKLEDIHTLDADGVKEFTELYNSIDYDDPIMKIIRKENENIGIKTEAIDLLRNSLLKLLLRKPTDPDPKGKNMAAKQKIKLVTLPENFDKDPAKPQAIWRIAIPVPQPGEEDEEAEERDKKAEEKKDKKKKEVNKSKKDVDTSKRSSAKGETEPEDKVAPVKPVVEDLFIYVYHEAGIKVLRDSIIDFFKAKFTKDLDGIETTTIKEKADEIGGNLEEIFLENYKDIPLFPEESSQPPAQPPQPPPDANQ